MLRSFDRSALARVSASRLPVGRAVGAFALSVALLGAISGSQTAQAAPNPEAPRQCMQTGTMIQCMGSGGMSQQSGGMYQGQGAGGSVQIIGAPPAPAAAPAAPQIVFPPMPPIQIQSSEAMPALPTDVPLAIGVARGEGGTYKVGENLNVAYAVNQPLTIRVIATQDGSSPVTLVEGSGDGTQGQVSATAGPAAGVQTFKIVGLASDGSVFEATVHINVVP